MTINNVGRNEPCPCGSGKKFKKCHALTESLIPSEGPSKWTEAATAVDFIHSKRDVIDRTFLAVSDDLKKNPNPGACHLISSVMAVLFTEQNVESKLMVGVVKRNDGGRFDHSWVEIDNKVFDVAIELTYDEQVNPPVFAGIDLGTCIQTKYVYGIGQSLDGIGKQIMRTPFVKYMDSFPGHRKGAWEIVQRIANRLELTVDIDLLRKKYENQERTQR